MLSHTGIDRVANAPIQMGQTGIYEAFNLGQNRNFNISKTIWAGFQQSKCILALQDWFHRQLIQGFSNKVDPNAYVDSNQVIVEFFFSLSLMLFLSPMACSFHGQIRWVKGEVG